MPDTIQGPEKRALYDTETTFLLAWPYRGRRYANKLERCQVQFTKL